MHPEPPPQKYPPPVLPLAGRNRRSAADGVVHVSAALVYVVVVDLPMVSRRTSYPIYHVVHAPFGGIPCAAPHRSPLPMDRRRRNYIYLPTPPIISYLYLSQ
eukprot:6212065-Pleurochrysis_carterae.AAC.5